MRRLTQQAWLGRSAERLGLGQARFSEVVYVDSRDIFRGRNEHTSEEVPKRRELCLPHCRDEERTGRPCCIYCKST